MKPHDKECSNKCPVLSQANECIHRPVEAAAATMDGSTEAHSPPRAPVCALAGSQQPGVWQPLPHLPSLPQTSQPHSAEVLPALHQHLFRERPSPSTVPGHREPPGLAWGCGGEEEPQPSCRSQPPKPQPDLSHY